MGRALKRLSGLFSPAAFDVDAVGGTVQRRAPAAAQHVAAAPPADYSEGAARFFEFHIVQDLDERWRWTLVTVNGHALARSFHAYDHYFECEEAIRRFELVDRRTPIIVRP